MMFSSVLASVKTPSALLFFPTPLTHDEKIAFAICLGISATLILRLWIVHRHDSVLKRIFWSAVLLIPLAGWIFYGAFYAPPPRNTVYTSGREYGDWGGPRL